MLGIVLAVVAGAQPSPGLAAAFASGLTLTLDGPAATDLSPPAPKTPADVSPSKDLYPEPRSKLAAAAETYGLELLEAGALGGLSWLSFFGAELALHPLCGGPPDYGGATVGFIVGGLLAAILPFVLAATTRWIFGLQGYDVPFWKDFAVSAVVALVVAPLAAYGVAAAAGGLPPGTLNAAPLNLEYPLFTILAPLGSVIAGLWGTPLAAAPPKAAAVPLVKLAFE